MSEALTPRLRALVELSAALGGRETELGGTLERAASVADRVEVEEVMLQAYLFVGFPAVLGVLDAWRALRGDGRSTDGGPEARPSEEEAPLAEEGPRGPEAWRRRGEALCRRVYGDAYEKLRRNVRRLHPDLERWMIEEGYGKVLSRPGLDLHARELCVVGLLGALGYEPALHSHLRGALRVGATVEEVGAALDVALGKVHDPEARRRWRGLWEQVWKAAVPDGSSGAV